MKHPARFGRKVTALCLFLGSLALAAHVSAQSVFLTFSGGGGTPVVITWSTPIVYTLTATTANSGVNPYFVFQGITNISTAVPVDTVGAIPGGGPTYTSTGVGSGDGTQTINSFYTTNPHGVVAANDLVFRATLDTTNTFLTSGDVITLSAGHLQSTNNYSGILPTSGLYNTFITDAAYGGNLGAGSAIPEPSTYAAIAGAAMLGLAVWHRRRRAIAPAAPVAAAAAPSPCCTHS